MQTTSDSLANAITSPSRRIRSDLSVDWDKDGHSGPSSFDDISRQVSSVKTNQTLSTQVPEQVRVIPGAGVTQLDAVIAGSNVFRRSHDVVFGDVSTYATASGEVLSTLSFTKPANAQVGDVLIVGISVVDNIIAIDETNVEWDLVAASIDSSYYSSYLYVFSRRVSDDDPAVYTFLSRYQVALAAFMIRYGEPYISGIHVTSIHTHNNGEALFSTIYGDPLNVTLDGCTIIDIFSAMSLGALTKWHFGATAAERVNHSSNVGGGVGANAIQGVVSYENVNAQSHVASATLIPAATILNSNPFFETDVSDWTTDAVIAQSSTYAHEGSSSLMLTNSGAISHIYSEHITAVAGTSYVFTGWYFAEDNSSDTNLFISWYDAGDVLLSTDIIDVTYVGGDGWVYSTGDATAPVNTSYCVVGALQPAKTAGFLTYFDELIVIESDGCDVTSTIGSVISIAIAPMLAGDNRQNPSWVYSEINPNSPLAGKERVNRPTRWDIAFATENGVETVQIFDGYTLGIDVSSRDRSATLTALDRREEFRNTTFLPLLVADWPRAIDGETLPYRPGLESTWPVAFILGKFRRDYEYTQYPRDGYYAAPPPRINTTCYVPCCGSLTPFLGTLAYAYAYHANDVQRAVRFDFGPYLGATEKAPLYGGIEAKFFEIDTGLRYFSSSGSASVGRCEFYARLDNVGLSTSSIGVISTNNTDDNVFLTIDDSGTFFVTVTINGESRVIEGVSVPSDGEWHAYGAHWDTSGPSGVADTTTYLGNGSSSHADNANVTPTLPAHSEGDVLLIFAAIRNTATGVPVCPTGYDTVYNDANMAVFGKIAGASESNPTVSFTGGSAGDSCSARMIAVENATLEVIDAVTQSNASAQNIATPSLVLNDSGYVFNIYFGWKADDCTGASPPAAASYAFTSYTTTGNDQMISVGYALAGEVGTIASDVFTVTGGTSEVSKAIVIALRALPIGNVTLCIDTTETDRIFTPPGVATTNYSSFMELSASGFMQLAEIHFIGGIVKYAKSSAISFSDPWVWENFTPTAIIDRSINELMGALYSTSDDDWATLTHIAEAEFAAVYFDASGQPHYRTTYSDVTSEGQTIVRTLTTMNAITDIGYTSDISLVANSITVPTSSVEYLLSTDIWSPANPTFLPRRTINYYYFSSQNKMFPSDNLVITLTEANTLADGTGTVIDASEFSYFIYPDANGYTGIIYMENNGDIDAWLVDSSGEISLKVTGACIRTASSAFAPAYVTDDESIAKYGEQPLEISSHQWRQSTDISDAIALMLLTDMRIIHPVLTKVSIVGDPRLELGDRVRIVDTNGIGLDDIYRIAGLTAEMKSSGFVQSIAARRSPDVAQWDVDTWNSGKVWGA